MLSEFVIFIGPMWASAPTSLRKSHTLRIPYVKYSTGANNATRIACRALGKPDPTAARRAFRRRKQNDNTYNETKSFSGATAPFASPAPLFSPFFSGKTEKNGPPEAICAILAQKKARCARSGPKRKNQRRIPQHSRTSVSLLLSVKRRLSVFSAASGIRERSRLQASPSLLTPEPVSTGVRA